MIFLRKPDGSEIEIDAEVIGNDGEALQLGDLVRVLLTEGTLIVTKIGEVACDDSGIFCLGVAAGGAS